MIMVWFDPHQHVQSELNYLLRAEVMEKKLFLFCKEASIHKYFVRQLLLLGCMPCTRFHYAFLRSTLSIWFSKHTLDFLHRSRRSSLLPIGSAQLHPWLN